MNLFAFQRDHLGSAVEKGLERATVDVDRLIKEDTAATQISEDRVEIGSP